MAAAGWLRRSFSAQPRKAALAIRCAGLGLLPPFLHHHDLKRLVDIDSELDRSWAPIKLGPGSLR